MTAKKRLSAADLRTGLKRAAERIQAVRQTAIERRDQHPEHSEIWSFFDNEAQAYKLSLHMLWVDTDGEFGEDFTEDGAQ
ncbi:hypothetical protein ACIBCH_09645 [Amycolatopsis thailandensis]|uniref:hypothetical protein n=1 Tax=Amycolatopsis thailandensis TaxID=589330 RepID=UPI00378C0715